jgi:hypothetical protein
MTPKIEAKSATDALCEIMCDLGYACCTSVCRENAECPEAEKMLHSLDAQEANGWG